MQDFIFFLRFLLTVICFAESYIATYIYSEENPTLLVMQIEDSGLMTAYQYIDAELICELSVNYDEEGRFISIIDKQEETTFTIDLSSNFDPYTHRISIEQMRDNIANACLSCFQYLQLSAQRAKKSWNNHLQLPTPILQALEKISKNLLGKSTYLLMGPHFEETHVACYGQHEMSNKVRVTFINGILNTRDAMLESLDIISESHGGVKVHYVFRPTEGWTWDISRAMMIKTAFTLGFRSLHAYLLAKMWRELIEEIGGIEGGGVILHYAHSLGGTETDRARELLTPEEQKMIRVVTLGSATMVRNEGFQSVINMVSINDGVSSFFLEPLGHIRNYFDPNTNVRFHGYLFNAPYWPRDHLLNGPTYGPLLQELGEKFLMEFN